MDREKVINDLQDAVNDDWMWQHADYYAEAMENAIAMLKEQDELLKHEYWRGYNNGRADERGLHEGTIMQTFSPD